MSLIRLPTPGTRPDLARAGELLWVRGAGRCLRPLQAGLLRVRPQPRPALLDAGTGMLAVAALTDEVFQGRMDDVGGHGDRVAGIMELAPAWAEPSVVRV